MIGICFNIFLARENGACTSNFECLIPSSLMQENQARWQTIILRYSWKFSHIKIEEYLATILSWRAEWCEREKWNQYTNINKVFNFTKFFSFLVRFSLLFFLVLHFHKDNFVKCSKYEPIGMIGPLWKLWLWLVDLVKALNWARISQKPPPPIPILAIPVTKLQRVSSSNFESQSVPIVQVTEWVDEREVSPGQIHTLNPRGSQNFFPFLLGPYYYCWLIWNLFDQGPFSGLERK